MSQAALSPRDLRGDPCVTGSAVPRDLRGDPGVTGSAVPRDLRGDRGVTGSAVPQGSEGRPWCHRQRCPPGRGAGPALPWDPLR